MTRSTILLIDADPAAATLIPTMLASVRSAQFDLEQADDLSEALEIVAQTKIEAILLTLSLPHNRGLGMLTQLRAEIPETPIIVLVGIDDEVLGVAAIQEGAQDYLISGQFDSSLLTRAVRYTLENRRTTEQIDFLRTLFSQVRNAVIATDADAKIIYWNPYAESLYQWTAQEMIGQSIYQVFVSAEKLDSVEATFARAEVVGSWEGEFTIQRRDGRTNPAYGTVTAITERRGKLKGFVASAVDITERKEAERELNRYREHLQQLVDVRTAALSAANAELQQEIARREQIETELEIQVALVKQNEERLRQLTDNMLDIIYQTDPDGIIEYASPSCMSVLGYPSETLLGQSIYSWLDPADVDYVREAIQTIGTVEYRYKHADGHFLWLETLSNVLFADDGRLKGFIFASRDITVRKQAERDLQELNRLKTEFLSTAAHELRTPLASILGFSEILTTRELDAARQKRYMRLINEQSGQLRKLVDALLDISRLESKEGLSLDLQPVRPLDLLTKALIPFSELTTKHQFKIEGLSEEQSILADPFRLSQVFQNLLTNAVKYSPNGGTISIFGQEIPGFLQISVQDQGIGMTPPQQTHLFERFYRADASNTSIGGTGLGLAISKLIVELHGGRIWVESQHGVGTTMFFTLPLQSLTPDPTARQSAHP